MPLGSLYFFQRISNSEQCSDWGGWVRYDQTDVQISKSVGHKNCFYVTEMHEKMNILQISVAFVSLCSPYWHHV